jgi:anti-anti-sigma factor
MNTFEGQQHSDRSVLTIVLPQRFDVHEVRRFESLIDQMMAGGVQVVLDASEVRFMDRTAIDALIDAKLRCMDLGGDLTLDEPSVAARVILELSGRFEAFDASEAAA